MRFYIIGPSSGEGVYHLFAETGEHLASHYCSNASFARGDLESNRPERKREWIERFGEYQVVELGSDSMTRDELVKRNRQLREALDSKV